MASAGRAIAGVAVAVAAALVLFVAFRGHGGTPAPAAAGTASAGLAPGGAADLSRPAGRARPGPGRIRSAVRAR